MPLSGLPSGGPSIPGGAQKVSLKDIDADSATANVDVTVLGDTQREYASPPLKDAGANGATATCSASGLVMGTGPTPTSGALSGWVLEDYEEVYEAGKYVTWSANWSYYPPTT